MSAPQAPGAVVLLSGGLDSTVALAQTLQEIPVRLALTFDYGQRAVEREVASAAALAEYYGLPHRVVALPWLAELLPEGLRVGAVPGASDVTLTQVWVPNRNGVFLNVAAAFAEALDCRWVVFGANAEEGAEFPDNTEEYRERLNAALACSTRNGVTVKAPLVHLDKQAIVETGQALGVPWDLIWSCYGPGPRHCGQCASCRRLKHAARAAGVTISFETPSPGVSDTPASR